MQYMPEIGVTLDPSIYQHGIAIWIDGKLALADLIRGIGAHDGSVEFRAYTLARITVEYIKQHFEEIDWFVIEDQVYRKGTRARALETLRYAAQKVAHELRKEFPSAKVYFVKPEAWKHAQSKASCEMHVRRLLDADEVSSVVDRRFALPYHTRRQKFSPELQEDALDMWDAVGIGMSHLKRGYAPRPLVLPRGRKRRSK